MKCLGQEYIVGETYKLPEDVKVKMCVNGYHFCLRQQDVLGYYSYDPEFVLLEIEAIGEVVTDGDKSVTDELRVIRILPREEYEFMTGNMMIREEWFAMKTLMGLVGILTSGEKIQNVRPSMVDELDDRVEWVVWCNK